MKETTKKSIDVIGLGNALMDFLVQVDDDELYSMNLTKGGMALVDEERAEELLKNLKSTHTTTAPGGSAANTVKGVAFLGGDTILCAKVGEDSHGTSYIEALESHGVSTRIGKHNSITGHALTFITPDTERTFSVHLGAALRLGKEDVLEEDVASSKVLHLEAYQFEGGTYDVLMHAISYAKKHGTLVSVDLADALLIERNRDLFVKIAKEHTDILFCNEDEAEALTGKKYEEALKIMAEMSSIAILKLGEEGSMISVEGKITTITPYGVNAVDTTGAGDSYAAGFLYGHTHGWSAKKSGQLGSLFASKVVKQIGVDIRGLDKNKIFQELESHENFN